MADRAEGTMTKRAKSWIAVVVCIALLLVIAVNLDDWLYLNCIHVGLTAEMDVFEGGYVFALDEDMKCMGQTQVLVYGELDGWNFQDYDGAFRGVIDVRCHSIPASSADWTYINEGRGYGVISKNGYLEFQYTTESNRVAQSSGESDWYRVVMDPAEPDALVILFQDEDITYAAVTGEDDDSARQTLVKYLDE